MIVMVSIAALYALANVVGYRQAYPTRASREQFARAFSDNIALRLFYGIPHDLATVGGYVEFRAMGMIGILGAAWMVFAAVRALRGEEESGCFELILAGRDRPRQRARRGARGARARVRVPLRRGWRSSCSARRRCRAT